MPFRNPTPALRCDYVTYHRDKTHFAVSSKRQGHRPNEEDRSSMFRIVAKNGDEIFCYIVCDGHGGDSISSYLIDEFPKRLFNKR